MFPMRHRAYTLRYSNRLCSSLPHHLISPNHVPAQSLTDKQLVQISETPASSVAVDDGTQVQNPPTSFVYQVAPPLYPPIAGVRARERGIAHNLMTDFVDMNNPDGFGVVMNLGELMAWIVSLG